MNQILLTENDDNKKKSNKIDYSKNNSNDIKKIISFFAVVILAFGLCIGGIYGYKTYKNSKGEEKIAKEPKVTFSNTEEEVTIIAESELGINKIIYQWNDEEEIVKELNGRTKQQENLEIPAGENELKVIVIDQIGQEKERQEKFTNNAGGQENSSKIIVSAAAEKINNIGTGKIIIKANSELPIKSITYKIDEDEEIEVELQEEEPTVVEQKIDIKNRIERKLNIITVKVTDIQGNSNTDEEKMEGRLKPEIDVYRDENKLYMKVTHDMGFEKIEYNLNGQLLTYDENSRGYDAEKQEIEFYFNLQEGENILRINAYSNEGTTGVYEGKATL